MKDKFAMVRERLLDGIETGKYPTGRRLPGARDLADTFEASFLLVQ